MHSLAIVNPGHFHAALTLRERHPLLDETVWVYSEDGPDLVKFLAIVEAFNLRAVNPTQWRLRVYRGADYLEKLLAERRADVAIVAGKNDAKLATIQRLQRAGIPVLGDKPWLIAAGQLPQLREVARGTPLAMDIMTERFEVTNRLQRALCAMPQVFGQFVDRDNKPAIYFQSVHHLYKLVNGKPLQRPVWYFDTKVQGRGIFDVTTHLVDLAQWMIGDENGYDFGRDVSDVTAAHWPTSIPLDTFERVTGLADFPPTIRDSVRDGALEYPCNATLRFRLRRVSVEIDALWHLIEPQGAGDLHDAVLRGTLADLIIDQGAHTGGRPRLTLHPRTKDGFAPAALDSLVAGLQQDFPGLTCVASEEGIRFDIPPTLRTTHEQHFSKVLDEFLRMVDRGQAPARIATNLECKYALLARAGELLP